LQNEPTDDIAWAREFGRLFADPSLSTEQILKRAFPTIQPHAKTRHNPPKPATGKLSSQNEPNPEPPPPTPLTPRQCHAARLLVAGQTAKAIAAQLGVNRHTISEWKKLPAFREELDRLLGN
jgi:DNA-binding NarL/FixJ family response regulator